MVSVELGEEAIPVVKVIVHSKVASYVGVGQHPVLS